MPDAKKDTLSEGSIETHKAGTLLVTENERSRKMFIIRKGKARVFKTYLDHRVTLAVLGAGEVFGEMSFFDAEPRSASVEALTDLTVAALDGDRAAQQIAGLPPWIFPIFKTIFHRFREADRKITVLQSMSEYQKKAFKTDSVGKSIYLELLRFIRGLELMVSQEKQAGPTVKSERVYKALDDILGGRIIGLRVFWNLLKEYEFIDNKREELDSVVEIKIDLLEKWKSYLLEEIKTERFLMLSHSSIALLGRTIGFISHENAKSPGGESMVVQFKDIDLENLPLYKDALAELKAKNLISVQKDSFTTPAALLGPLYTYQSILKVFDHTIINLE